ncbi:MAG: ECF transporter S component, partial [Candidatus Korarchaeum sp.]
MPRGSVSKLVAIVGVMAALTTLATMVVQIPTPATKGYINLGDTMVMLSGSLFGSLIGSISGGVGSALADLLSGYAHWAPFTLVIKG